MTARDEMEDLPAFKRSQQISDIFNSVQNVLPDMDFSDIDENEGDTDVDYTEIVKRKPVVTRVSNRDQDLPNSEEEEENSIQDDSIQDQDSSQRAEKEMVELSVHSFIDSLVGQISEAPASKKSDSYKLEQNTDIDLDKLIDMLESAPDIAIEDREYESDEESFSSSSTIVMDELERLAESYDTSEYDNNMTTPREITPSKATALVKSSPSNNSTPQSNNSSPQSNNSTPIGNSSVSRSNKSNDGGLRATYGNGISPVNKFGLIRGEHNIRTPSPSALPEPETVKLDLRPKSPSVTGNPRPTSGRIVPAYLTKKQEQQEESDSDDEIEQNSWLEMRRNMKSTSFFKNENISSTEDGASGGGISRSCGTSTMSSGTSTSGVSTRTSGVSTQSLGASTRNCGVSTQNSGSFSEKFDMTSQICGVSTKFFGSRNGTSAEDSAPVMATFNSDNGRSLEDYTAPQSDRASQGGGRLRNKPPKRSKISDSDACKKILKKSDLKDDDNQEKIRAEDISTAEDKENSPMSPKTAWSDNNANVINDNTKYVDESKSSESLTTIDKDEAKIVAKKEEGDLMKQRRLELMKLREKRSEFKKRLESQNVDLSTQLIFDVEESFGEVLVDLTEEEGDVSGELLVMQLMIDNQGELSSLPPEYYAFCYSEIPTVSYYGTEGVVTWMFTSQCTPFTVLSSRLTFINNCLTYIFLVKSKVASPSFYKDVGVYLSKHTIAQSDPSLFKSTLLNPRDYPFCEPLNKLFLLSKYDPDQCTLFSSQPSCFTFNLTLDKSPDNHKKKLSVTELQSNVSPPTKSEFCVSTLSGSVLVSQGGLFHVLASVRDAQLEISGARMIKTQTDTQTLCLVVSGYSATSKWAEKLGPVDPGLALRTDPDSVRAVLRKLDLTDFTLTNTRTVDKTRQELARYFGYRFSDTLCSLPSPSLTYPAVFERSYDFFFLLVSPLISPSLLGEILQVLQDNGVSLMGIRRCRLNYRKCLGLGLSESQIKVFSKFNGTPLTSPSLSSSNGSTPGEIDRQFFPQNFKTDASPSQPTLASTIIFLTKRNGLYHSRHIIRQLKSRVVDVNISHTLQSDEALLSREQLTDPYLYFEIVPYSENDLWNVGGQFGLAPERKTFDFFMSHKQEVITEKCDLEQIVFIGLIGKEVVQSAGQEIYDIIHFCETLGLPCADHETGLLELLGVKMIGKLNSFQAREVTQYEVGDARWKSDIQYLQTVPILALIVRGINAFSIVKQLLTHKEQRTSRRAPRGATHAVTSSARDYSRIMSETPEHAYKLASLLFFEKELYSDEIMRPKQLHLPPPRTHVNSVISKEGRTHLSDLPERLVYQSEGILKSMLSPPRLIPSVLITSQVQHFGKILKRLEQDEFTLIGGYLSRDDRVILCVQAENAVYKLCQLVGPSDLKEAKKSHQFSLRASFASHPDDFYASQTYADSVRDVKEYFPGGLCCENTLDLQAEGIPHSYLDTVVSMSNSRRYVSRPCLLKPLLQTVCLVVPPDLLRPAKHMRLSPASQLITLIQTCQFEIVNMRLLTLPPPHIHHFRGLFKIHAELAQTFVNRACLVLVLQRENAASCFNQILQGYSNSNNKKLLQSYEHMLLTSSSKQKCEQEIRFFFDFLSSRCKDGIEA